VSSILDVPVRPTSRGFAWKLARGRGPVQSQRPPTMPADCSCTAPPGSGSGSGSRSFKFQRTRASMERAARTRTRRESPLGTGQVGASSASPVAASLSEAYIAQQNRGTPPPRTRSARPRVGPLISADIYAFAAGAREGGGSGPPELRAWFGCARHGGRQCGTAEAHVTSHPPSQSFIRDMRCWFTCSRLGHRHHRGGNATDCKYY
jgi:hypothetical protein